MRGTLNWKFDVRWLTCIKNLKFSLFHLDKSLVTVMKTKESRVDVLPPINCIWYFPPNLVAAQALEATHGVLQEENSSLDFYFLFFFSLFKAYSCYQSDEVNEAEEIIFTTGGGNHLFLWIGRPTDQSGEQSRRQLVGISSARFFAQRWGFPQVVFKPPPATWAVVSRRQHLLQSTHISQSSALIGCFELVSFNSSAV